MTAQQAVSRFVHSWSNGGRYKILAVAIGVSLLWAAGVFVFVQTRPKPFDPLDPYPLVEIIAPVEAVDFNDPIGSDLPVTLNLPTIQWDGSGAGPVIAIRGTVCNGSDARVPVVSSINWARLDRDAQSTYDGGQASGTRLPGCVTISYDLVPPALALDRIRNVADDGIYRTRWELQGTDVPIGPDGEPGVSQSFTSQTFVIEWTGT